MRHKHYFLLLTCLILSLLSTNASGQKRSFNKKSLKKHIEYLASDSLKGRKPGTAEGKLAAEYIKNQLVEYGYRPLGKDGFQYFEVVTDIAPDPASEIMINSDSASHSYAISNLFTPMVISEESRFSGQLCFAGFGIKVDQDQLKWNSYEDLDVKNKVVMVLDGDPDIENNDSPYIPYSGLRDKLLIAEDAGAAAFIFVQGSLLDKKGNAEAGYFDRAAGQASIPVISMSRHLADSILMQTNGESIDAIEKKIVKEQKAINFTTPITIKGDILIDIKKVQTQNVIAELEGTDPSLKDEYILIGAHYDHLGMGGYGSGSRMPDTTAIHNGADDNASGVSGILEIARRLEANHKKLKRSVIIMAFGAEEMGLIGSKFLSKHPEFSLKSSKAMFNYDMIGRLDPEKNSILIAGTKTSKEGESILDAHKKDTDLKLSYSPEGYGASDHATFYAEDIPVFFFSTGAHPDYHTPFDDEDRINYEGMEEVLDYSYAVLMDVLNRDQPLSWQTAGPKKRQKYGRRFKVTLGIMPDFTATENNGLGVGGVTKDGPAFNGKMEKGDIITAIEGKPVKNIYDYMNRLKLLKPGQTISVDVIRSDQHKILIITL